MKGRTKLSTSVDDLKGCLLLKVLKHERMTNEITAEGFDGHDSFMVLKMTWEFFCCDFTNDLS